MWNAAEVATRPDRFAHDAELRALLAKVALQDRAAFRCLYRALRPALVRHLYRQLPRADLVEELLNDVMYVVWQNAGNYRGDAQVTTWVLGIATMKSHRARQRWRRDQVFTDHSEISDSVSTSDDADTGRWRIRRRAAALHCTFSSELQRDLRKTAR